MAKQQKKRWDQYVKEARKPPFEMEVEGEEDIVIEAPTGAQVIEAQRLAAAGDGDVEKQLRLICGEDVADRVVALVRDAPAGAMNDFLADIMEHFGFSAGEADSRT